MKPRFSVPVGGQKYSDNWQRIFEDDHDDLSPAPAPEVKISDDVEYCHPEHITAYTSGIGLFCSKCGKQYEK